MSKFSNNIENSNLLYKKHKLENSLNIKITNEEEKYIYLIKKLNEYEYFVSILIFNTINLNKFLKFF